jgi:hypothetical protein
MEKFFSVIGFLILAVLFFFVGFWVLQKISKSTSALLKGSKTNVVLQTHFLEIIFIVIILCQYLILTRQNISIKLFILLLITPVITFIILNIIGGIAGVSIKPIQRRIFFSIMLEEIKKNMIFPKRTKKLGIVVLLLFGICWFISIASYLFFPIGSIENRIIVTIFTLILPYIFVISNEYLKYIVTSFSEFVGNDLRSFFVVKLFSSFLQVIVFLGIGFGILYKDVCQIFRCSYDFWDLYTFFSVTLLFIPIISYFTGYHKFKKQESYINNVLLDNFLAINESLNYCKNNNKDEIINLVGNILNNEMQEPWVQEHEKYVDFMNNLIAESDIMNDNDDESIKNLKAIISRKKSDIYADDICFRPLVKLYEVQDIIVNNSTTIAKKKMDYQILILKNEIDENSKDESKILGIALGLLTTIVGFLINQQGSDILRFFKILFNG